MRGGEQVSSRVFQARMHAAAFALTGGVGWVRSEGFLVCQNLKREVPPPTGVLPKTSGRYFEFQ
jgi:hypothetical protein